MQIRHLENRGQRAQVPEDPGGEHSRGRCTRRQWGKELRCSRIPQAPGGSGHGSGGSGAESPHPSFSHPCASTSLHEKPRGAKVGRSRGEGWKQAVSNVQPALSAAMGLPYVWPAFLPGGALH